MGFISLIIKCKILLPRHVIVLNQMKTVSEYDQKHCRPTHGTVKKSQRAFTATRHLKENTCISKATSSLFLVKMIAKLETLFKRINQLEEFAKKR